MKKLNILIIIILIISLLISCTRYIRSLKLKLSEPALFINDMDKILDYKYFSISKPKKDNWYILKSEQYIDRFRINYISQSKTFTAFMDIECYDLSDDMNLDQFKKFIIQNSFQIKNKERFEEISKKLEYEIIQNFLKCSFEQLIKDNEAINLNENNYLIMRNIGYILYKKTDKNRLFNICFSERGTNDEINKNNDEVEYLINSVLIK